MPTPSTLLGAVTGLVLSRSIALVVGLVVKGKKNPGVAPEEFSAAGGASAPLPHEDPGRGSFGSLDLNQDNRLSLAEAAGYGDIMTRFRRADRNKDGKLTRTEFDRLAKLPPPKTRAKPKLRLREDAAASLSAARREGQ